MNQKQNNMSVNSRTKDIYLALCQQSRELALLKDYHVFLNSCYLRHHTLQHDLLPESNE